MSKNKQQQEHNSTRNFLPGQAVDEWLWFLHVGQDLGDSQTPPLLQPEQKREPRLNSTC